MKPEQTLRRRLRNSNNKILSSSLMNDSNESGVSFLIDSPPLFNLSRKVPKKSSKIKKRKSNISCQQSSQCNVNKTITLDSSCEVIDKSTGNISIENEFDWINTPRSARNRNKFNIDSISTKKSPNSKKNIQNDKENFSIKPIQSKQVTSKTQAPNMLAGSKRRNVENWLTNAVDQPVITPPMSLSPPSKTYLDQAESDALVERELRLLYGDDWNADSVKRSQTENKKSKHRSPQFFLTGARPYKTTNLQLTGGKMSRKNVRRKVFENFSDKKSVTNDNVVKNLQYSDPKSLTKKLKRKLSPCIGDKINPTPTKTPRRTFLASLSVSTPTSANHPEAQAYKLNFAKKKEELCSKLFKLYNSEVFSNQLPDDMLIEWNSKMRGTAGYCYTKRKKTREGIVRTARLQLSQRVLDRADRLRDTLIHEMCHAATWIIDGVQDGHGPIWLSWAQKVSVRFPELPSIKRCHNYKIATKFTYRCTVCSYSINRQSRSIDVHRKRCGRCYGVLELLFNKKKRGLTEAPEFETTRTIRAPNRFALYVKENYKRVKESMTGEKKHANVMKMLSEEYKNSLV